MLSLKDLRIFRLFSLNFNLWFLKMVRWVVRSGRSSGHRWIDLSKTLKSPKLRFWTFLKSLSIITSQSRAKFCEKNIFYLWKVLNRPCIWNHFLNFRSFMNLFRSYWVVNLWSPPFLTRAEVKSPLLFKSQLNWMWVKNSRCTNLNLYI